MQVPPAVRAGCHGRMMEVLGFRVSGLDNGLYWGNIGTMEKKMETTMMGIYRV